MSLSQTEQGFAVGLDIGGTSIVAGILAKADGQVLSRATVPTESRRGHADGLERIHRLIEQVAADAGVRVADAVGIGVGCTGPVDSVTGVIQNPFTLPGWDDLAIIPDLESHFQRPALLLNDCHVAALGEFWQGAGRGAQHMVYMTVGTGIGSGLILNGQLYRGNGLLSGEVGHLALDPAGPLCYCGGRGCLEMLAAGPAIVAAGGNAPVDSRIWDLADQHREAITAKIVCQAAAERDPYALQVITNAATYLGIGITNILNVLTPEVVVLGGGVMQSWQLFTPTIEQIVRERDGMLKTVQVKILPAALGLDAGITGAAFAILKHAAEH